MNYAILYDAELKVLFEGGCIDRPPVHRNKPFSPQRGNRSTTKSAFHHRSLFRANSAADLNRHNLATYAVRR
jgi:hypothetical protein